MMEMTDEQLQRLSAEGQREAEEALAARYVRLVRVCSRPYFLAGGDSEDLLQEGMFGLLYAIREYDPEKGTSFRTYAEICIRSRILSAVRNAGRKKHAPLNNGISLEELSDDSSSLGTPLTLPGPEEQVLAREAVSELLSASSRYLSRLESRILTLYLEGLSYQEIAEETGRDGKSVDNAVQRIRRKLAKTFFQR